MIFYLFIFFYNPQCWRFLSNGKEEKWWMKRKMVKYVAGHALRNHVYLWASSALPNEHWHCPFSTISHFRSPLGYRSLWTSNNKTTSLSMLQYPLSLQMGTSIAVISLWTSGSHQGKSFRLPGKRRTFKFQHPFHHQVKGKPQRKPPGKGNSRPLMWSQSCLGPESV